MDKKYEIYDTINTIAVKWLKYNKTIHNQNICIKFKNNFKYYWFMHILENFRVFDNYNVYYVECNLIRYIILRYIKNFKGAKKYHKKREVFKIDVDYFINELLASFDNKYDITIIQEIYKTYWEAQDVRNRNSSLES